MEEKLFAKLLLEHKNDLAEIRSIALKFIKYASDHVKNEGVLDIKLAKTINREKFVELFIKMSSLIMKLIPLEQQVYGNSLVSKNDLKRLKNKHKKELDINEPQFGVLESNFRADILRGSMV